MSANDVAGTTDVAGSPASPAVSVVPVSVASQVSHPFGMLLSGVCSS